MATVNLGAIRFNWKGAYNNSTAYVADDVVSSAGNSYICILASTGNAVSNATYWSIMSSAGTNGTNGTDIGTTITTQGDVLFRDGSGLQRLAKGTASQALTMNAGATAPEWTTAAGGGWTVLQSTNVTSNVSNVVLTGISSTYNTHMFTCTDFVPTQAGTSLCLRFGTSSATSGYSGANDYGYHVSKTDDASAGYAAQAHATQSYMQICTSVNTGTDSGHIIGWIGGHGGNGNELYAHGTGVNEDTGADTQGGQWWGKKHGDLSNTWDRCVFLFSSGSVAAGRFTLYGLKNS